VTWQHALDFVAGINNDTYDCGDTSNAGINQTDWRLPNRNELTSLLDLGTVNPALPSGHPFTNFVSSLYWSSTTFAFSADFAWVVVFLNGSVDFDFKAVNFFFVIAVRGGS
jgi:hypothetical protein